MTHKSDQATPMPNATQKVQGEARGMVEVFEMKSPGDMLNQIRKDKVTPLQWLDWVQMNPSHAYFVTGSGMNGLMWAVAERLDQSKQPWLRTFLEVIPLNMKTRRARGIEQTAFGLLSQTRSEQAIWAIMSRTFQQIEKQQRIQAYHENEFRGGETSKSEAAGETLRAWKFKMSDAIKKAVALEWPLKTSKQRMQEWISRTPEDIKDLQMCKDLAKGDEQWDEESNELHGPTAECEGHGSHQGGEFHEEGQRDVCWASKEQGGCSPLELFHELTVCCIRGHWPVIPWWKNVKMEGVPCEWIRMWLQECIQEKQWDWMNAIVLHQEEVLQEPWPWDQWLKEIKKDKSKPNEKWAAWLESLILEKTLKGRADDWEGDAKKDCPEKIKVLRL